MSICTPRRVLVGLAATCLAGGVAASIVGTGAAATTTGAERAAERPSAHDTARPTPYDEGRGEATTQGEGVSLMAAPYIPGVPHVPADTLLALSPDGPRLVGPEGSLFAGPADRVEQRVQRWWDAQMAAGVSPEEADRRLADMAR